jgi:hypothetical protein
MVELQIVVLAVAGSSPVGHPLFIFDFGSIADLAGMERVDSGAARSLLNKAA